MAHVDFAADFQHLGCAFERRGHIIDGTGICRHVFAGAAIPAGGGPDKLAPLIAQGKRQPVDLRFRRVGKLVAIAEAEVLANAAVELLHILVRKGIAERQHGHRMLHLAKAIRRGRTHLFRGAVGAFELWKSLFYGVIALPEPVILRIRDLGGVGTVIGLVRRGQRIGKPRQFLFRLGRVQILYRNFRCQRDRPPPCGTGF